MEITSIGRSEFKFNQKVVINPEAQKMSLDRDYAFPETSMRRLQQVLNFIGEFKKTQVTCIRRSRLKIGQKNLHTRRYTELSADLGSEARKMFHHGTEMRYPYVSVGVKMHTFCTISKHQFELAA